MERKYLSVSSLSQALISSFNYVKDWRSKKPRYPINLVLSEAFKCFLFQYPSLRQYDLQRRRGMHNHNDGCLISQQQGVSQTQLRTIIDFIESTYFSRSFKRLLRALQRSGKLSAYRVLGCYYAIAIDGVTHYSSKHIFCPSCLKRKDHYQHQVLQPYLCHPDSAIVLPLMPEAIRNTDGIKKQDCELKASYRLLPNLRKAHPKLPILIMGDGLFSKQPFIERCLKEGFSYLLMAKPSDHKHLFEMIDGARAIGSLETKMLKEQSGYTHHYSYANGVPLNGREDAVSVNVVTLSLLFYARQ